jgi:cell division protein FtsB|tara:strand:+ start:339 stop:536 length:198 start_codon:yes stop_codon:yes gene_type:complete
MPSLKEMAEAHLLNVQREIQTLKQRQVEIGEEIKKLESYLEEGVRDLNEPQSEATSEEVSEIPSL